MKNIWATKQLGLPPATVKIVVINKTSELQIADCRMAVLGDLELSLMCICVHLFRYFCLATRGKFKIEEPQPYSLFVSPPHALLQPNYEVRLWPTA